jgi:hypothetical protein
MIPKLYTNRIVSLGDCEIEETFSFTPRSIDRANMPLLFKDVAPSLKTIAREIIAADWKIYVVDQSRGYCSYTAKIITVPTWAVAPQKQHFYKHKGKPLQYKQWYIAHELAHAYTASAHHGPIFMQRLIDTCPEDSIHFELGYKPRNARAAGIIDDLGLD